MGPYIPYIFNEKPELEAQFDGFTYYSNTASLGIKTNISTPSLFGGYEYTPAELNARDQELLVDKQNEALKVLPVMFDQTALTSPCSSLFTPVTAGCRISRSFRTIRTSGASTSAATSPTRSCRSRPSAATSATSSATHS